MPFNLCSFPKRRDSRILPDPENPSARFPKAHRFDRQLQKGSQGFIEQWTHVASDTVVAVKVIIGSKQKKPAEVQILQELPAHKSIIRCLGFYEKQPSPDKVSILFEYCPHGDLFMVRVLSVETHVFVFSEAFMWSVYRQLAGALAFLHDGIDEQHPTGRDKWRTVAHRDIKFENILVKSLGAKDDWSDIDLKLGDFGMAGYHDPANPNPHGYIATTHYWPPEVKWETKYLTPASDIWGIAAIMHELAHNFGPLVSPDVTQARWFLHNKHAPYSESWPETLRKSYWASQTPRRVVPINLEVDAVVPSLSDPDLGYDRQAIALRKCRPSPRYSDTLNECMMAGLAMSVKERVGAEELLRLIEGGYSDFLFQNLSLEHEQETVLQDVESGGAEELGW